jgi:protein TonB
MTQKKATREVKKETTPEKVYPTETKSLSAPLDRYVSVVQKRIVENLTYPSSAKEAGFQGTVKLSLLLSYRGELLEAKVKESSGYNILDENALKVAKEISSYPPFPPSIEAKEILVDVPIAYRLD